MYPVEPLAGVAGPFFSACSVHFQGLQYPTKQTISFWKTFKDNLLQRLSPPLITLHSQKVPIHNQDVYCFEWISFPSVLFLLAMESSWEGFDSSVMNLKAVLKTLLQLLFRQPNKLDSAGICHRERQLSPYLAVCWESHYNFGGWDLSGQKWPLVQKLCEVIMP